MASTVTDVGRSSSPPGDADAKGEGEKSQVQALSISDSQATDGPAGGYRLYKRRWVGVFVLVRNEFCLLSVRVVDW